MVRKGYCSLAAIGIFLLFGSISLSKAVAPTWKAVSPTWSYRIENMVDFSMSSNGDYLIAACTKGPQNEERQFYVFDRYGNIVKNEYINSEITAVDIADNGTFFIGTPNGYYFSSVSGGMQENPVPMTGNPTIVSMPKNGEIAVVGTEIDILICDKNDMGHPKPVPDDSTIIDLAISDDGSIIACGISTGVIWILDSQLAIQETWKTQGELTSIALTADGSHLVYGTREGRVFCLDSSGNLIWEYPGESSEESSEDRIVQDIAVSSDGSLVAVLSENVILLNSSGEELQELNPSGTIQHIQLSHCGEILSFSLRERLAFMELFQRDYVETHEFMLSSKVESESTSLNEAWSSEGDSPQSVIEADIDGDGQMEIICSFPKKVVVLDSKGIELPWRKGFESEPEIAAMDLDFDFIPEVVVTSKDNLFVFDENGILLTSMEFTSMEFYKERYGKPPPEKCEITIRALWSGDIDSDGFIEVVCSVSATSPEEVSATIPEESQDFLKSRGIYVFEYHLPEDSESPSLNLEWSYQCAPNVKTVNIVDLDSDGELEIVWGSSAPCNGAVVKDTDDCHTYVYAINLQGEELWIKEIGLEYNIVRIAVADLDCNGTNEVVCSGRFFKSPEKNWGTLFVLDAQGNYVDGIRLDHSVYLKSVSDLDSDGDMEILVCDVNGALKIYDHNLQLVRESDAGVPFSSDLTVNDLDGDGQKEIIAISSDRSIIILDRYLEQEWTGSFPVRVSKAVVVNLSHCKNDLLVLADKLYLFSYEKQSSQPCALPTIEDEIINHFNRGNDCLEKGDYQKAIEEFELAAEMLRRVGSIESVSLSDITDRQRDAYEKYQEKLLEAEEYFEEGIHLKDLGDYQKAAEKLLNAREAYNSIGKVKEVDDMLLSVAEQLLQEGIRSLESRDLEKAEEALLEAKEIFHSIGETENVQEIKEIYFPLLAEEYNEAGENAELEEDYEEAIDYYDRAWKAYRRQDRTEDLLKKMDEIDAQKYVVEGKLKESQGDYREAVQSYEEALNMYQELDNEEESKKVQTMLDHASIPIININIIRIAFIISTAVVTFVFFNVRRKEYKDRDKRADIANYGFTLIALGGILVISHIAVSLPLGGRAYLMTVSMCFLYVMILSTYLRRPQYE